MIVEGLAQPSSINSLFDAVGSTIVFYPRRANHEVWMTPPKGGLYGLKDCLDLLDKRAEQDDELALESLNYHVVRGDFIKCAHGILEAVSGSWEGSVETFRDVVGELRKIISSRENSSDERSITAKKMAHEYFRRALNALYSGKKIQQIRAMNSVPFFYYIV